MSEQTGKLDSAIAHKNAGEYDLAEADLRAVLETEPDCAEAHHQLGLVYGFTGQFDEAVEELKRAAELAPDSVTILNDLGLTYAMIGMYDEARAVFEQVLRIDPGNAVAKKNLSYF